jgi:hypothetical protein
MNFDRAPYTRKLYAIAWDMNKIIQNKTFNLHICFFLLGYPDFQNVF